MKKVKEMQEFAGELRLSKKTIGFVPTMGYLHQGHMSLVQESKARSSFTVVSIFVNPTQFAPNEDLAKYPRDLKKDCLLLENAGVDVLFFPDAQEIYPEGFDTYIYPDSLSRIHEGEFRPIHFRGVCTIVGMLFNIVKPHFAFFGQKDAQQAAVIKRMCTDLKFDLEVVVCPIIRENDGLAMSSRNVYLAPKERQQAVKLYESLLHAQKLISEGVRNTNRIVEEMIQIIKGIENHKLDYIRIVNAVNFSEVEMLKSGADYYILIACRVGVTRLIDNELIRF
ncbi:MAG TPA: pantoate--beta-alanine ligase [Ignavibacteriaceae bacterium]|nr:pantoate--beta-alanine ligase [Ignavibacteriaceae bacterium]